MKCRSNCVEIQSIIGSTTLEKVICELDWIGNIWVSFFKTRSREILGTVIVAGSIFLSKTLCPSRAPDLVPATISFDIILFYNKWYLEWAKTQQIKKIITLMRISKVTSTWLRVIFSNWNWVPTTTNTLRCHINSPLTSWQLIKFWNGSLGGRPAQL